MTKPPCAAGPSVESLPAETCRTLVATLARVGDKWSMLIIVTLEDGALRFNALRRRIGVSQKVLTGALRGLESDGYLTRSTTPTTPVRVDYALTAMGRGILGTGAGARRLGAEPDRAHRGSEAALRRPPPTMIGLHRGGPRGRRGCLIGSEPHRCPSS